MKKITRFQLVLAAMIALATVAVSAQPSTSATTPPALSSGNVISIFSDAFTNVTGTDFFPNWGQSTLYSASTIGTSDHIIKYSNMNYQGIQIGSAQVCTSMKYLHLDVWTNDANAATFPIGIIWTGGEKTVTKTIATNGSWTSLDIPLSEFTGAVLSSVIQFKFQSNEWFSLGVAGSTSKYTTVYLDNIYFWSDASADTQAPTGFTATAVKGLGSDIMLKLNATDNSGALNYTITYGTTTLTTTGVSGVEKDYTVTGLSGSTAYSFSVTCKDAAGNVAANSPIVVPITTGSSLPASPTPTVAVANVKSVYSDAYTASVTNFVYLTQQWWNSTWSAVTLADAGNALKLIATTAGGGGGGIQFDPLTITGMTNLHFDVYPATDAASATIKYCVTPTGTWYVLPTPTNHSTLTANVWNSFDIPVSSLASGASTLPTQVGFGTFSGPGTFYIDNVVFYKGTWTFANGINDVLAAPAIQCYMKSNNLIVSCESQMSEVTVRNLLGQNIKTEVANTNSKTIDLSGLVSGNYIVVAKMTNGQVSTQKFVK